MKEIRIYSDRSYATEILCNETVSLEDAIVRCKRDDLMILILKNDSTASKYLQVVSINHENKIRISEQSIESNTLVTTWTGHDIYDFIRLMKANFPTLEGYVISSYSELYKIMKVHFPGWVT